MGSISGSSAYVALLRGINVGGRHKVPMAQLREELQNIGCYDIHTILNSGNVIFTKETAPTDDVTRLLVSRFKERFGFGIHVWVTEASNFAYLFKIDPFEQEILHKDLRFYINISGC